MKKRHIIIILEFFNDVDPEQLENQLRANARRKSFPAFRKCDAYVHHKNLRPINITDKVPLAIVADDIEKSDDVESEP